MQNIVVKRYADPSDVGWAGCIEPDDRTWIAFIRLDGVPVFFLDRDPVTGEVRSASTPPPRTPPR